ncbi:hypothetical protein Tco_0696657 [Tanacetum coccineum]
MEPKNVKEAMTDPAWIESMQEELLQFKRLDHDGVEPVYEISLSGVRVYRQEEGIDVEESSYVADWNIRIFLAYAAHKSFTVSSMLIHPSHVKVKGRAIYGLKHAQDAYDDDILAVTGLVDDIIFGYTTPRYQGKQTKEPQGGYKDLRYLRGSYFGSLVFEGFLVLKLTGFSNVIMRDVKTHSRVLSVESFALG